MPHEPQIPSRHDLRKASVGSTFVLDPDESVEHHWSAIARDRPRATAFDARCTSYAEVFGYWESLHEGEARDLARRSNDHSYLFQPTRSRAPQSAAFPSS